MILVALLPLIFIVLIFLFTWIVVPPRDAATIITGASGILKIKFQQWAQDSVLSTYIISIAPINNGSFDVRFRKI